MLRNSVIVHAQEFAQKTKSGQTWPRSGYGWSYLFNGRKRRFWTRSVRLGTTDRNRLVSYSHRFGDVIAQINKEETEKLSDNFSVDDIRVDDFRKVKFNCPTCGSLYARTMKGRAHYMKGCPKGCDSERNDPSLYPNSAVPCIEKASAPPPVSSSSSSSSAGATNSSSKNKSVSPLLDRIQLADSDRGSKERLGKMPSWSNLSLKVKCVDCDEPYRSTSMRALSGNSFPGGLDTSDLAEFNNRCPTCRHKLSMRKAAEAMGATAGNSSSKSDAPARGYYGGLSF